MTTLNINGKRVKVGDSFNSLSPDQQNATVDEIAKSLGSAAPSPQAPAPASTPSPAPEPSKAYTGAILPISRDEQGSVHFDPNAGILGAITRAITLPGEAMAGKIDPTSQEGIGRAAEFAGVFSGTSPASGTGKAISVLPRLSSAKDAPPVAPGFVRMYHGGDGEIDGAERLFSSNRGHAEGRAAQTDGNVYYTDVPRSDRMFDSASPDQTVDQGFTVNSRLSPEMSDGRRLVREPGTFLPLPPRPGMEAAAAAGRIGVDLPRAVASDSAVVQQGGKVLSNVPIGGTPLRESSKKAITQIGEAADQVQAGYGSGNIANAGAGARQGISEYAKVTLPNRVTDAYNKVDDLITQNVTTPLGETAKVATDISSRRANAALPESGAVKLVQQALSQRDGLNYQGIKDLRTNIGELLDNPQNITASGFSEGELKRIYGGLTADLKNAVGRSGGERASAAFEEANKLAAKTAREREGLQKVLGRDASDERIFDRITAMAGSNSRADRVAMARVRGAVSDDTWNDLASGVISKLGRDAEGNFSPDRFVTGWGKLSAEGKSQLFGGKSELASSLDDIAKVSSQFKRLNQYANPSGTGQTVIGASYLSGALLDPTTVVGSVVGARVLSSIMAKPTSARALAAYANAYQRQAVAPTSQSLLALQNSARALSAYIGNETGSPGIAQQIFPSISSVRQVPADQRGENNGLPEGQNDGVGKQLRVLSPNET